MRPIILKYFILISLSLCLLNTKAQDSPDYRDIGWDLLYAADIGDIDKVQKIVFQGGNPDFENEDGVTALMLASQAGYNHIVDFLIRQGADVNKKSSYFGITPLISAARNDFLRTAELLIRKGAEIDDNDNWGRQAIHYAVINNFIATTDMLIYYEADINGQDAFGNTPIMYSVAYKHDTITKMLIDNNAELFIKNDEKNSLMHIAAQHGNLFFIENYHHLFRDKKLLNDDGLLPIEIAILHGHKDILEFLVNSNYKLRDTINDVYTPMTFARQSNNRKTVRFLKKKDIADMHYPYFRKLGGGINMLFNSSDFFWDFNVGISEDRYGFLLHSGFLTRGSPRAVLLPKAKNQYYQYYENRYGVYLSLKKQFKLHKWKNNHLSIAPSVKPVFMWGNYVASNKKITSDIKVSAGASIILDLESFVLLEFGYSYFDMNIISTKPHFYSLGFNFLIPFRSKEDNEKYKYIINY